MIFVINITIVYPVNAAHSRSTARSLRTNSALICLGGLAQAVVLSVTVVLTFPRDHPGRHHRHPCVVISFLLLPHDHIRPSANLPSSFWVAWPQAVVLSVTVVLIFGEIIPAAIFTGPRQLAIAAAMTNVTW
jgi:hypothetical protein